MFEIKLNAKRNDFSYSAANDSIRELALIMHEDGLIEWEDYETYLVERAGFNAEKVFTEICDMVECGQIEDFDDYFYGEWMEVNKVSTEMTDLDWCKLIMTTLDDNYFITLTNESMAS